ncbi:DNA polymerase I [Peptoniphilus harei]|uniref:DNA polymerase I n=1 Tax=Peptoniphilus harei TaxID=54005 RepID=A0A2X1Y4K0_9FIRM|nr:DNA polymerase I [Peptoniphilus harei]QQT90722.1 DNA polymerase I [Peptoniphilus harei]SPY48332.1 DNA polymerase I [Peptoniphilus harei]
MDNKFLIIDGSSLFFRAFYALPLLKTKRGLYTNAIYGFVMMVENAIEKINPSHVAVCFDMKGKTFRSDIYKDYKGTRQKTPNELEQQWPLVREILGHMNIKILESPVYEADDIAGTLAKLGSEEGFENYLLTGDKDYFQLVNENTKVLFTRKGITDMDIVTVDKIEEDYGIEPLEFIELKALMGDSSDNIPGIYGIGEKTGLKLVRQFHTLENLYDNIDDVSGKKLKEKLVDGKTAAFMSKKLGTIVRDVPIEESLDDLKKLDYDYEKLSELYREFEFNSMLDRLPEEYRKEEVEEISQDNFEFVEIKDLRDIEKEIKDKKSFAFKFITDGKIYEDVKPIYLAIKVKDSEVKIISYDDIDFDFLKDLMEDEDVEKLGYSLKEDIIILMDLGIDIKNYSHDVEIAEYLLNSTKSDYDINKISMEYFKNGYLDLEDLLGKGAKKKTYADLDKDGLFKYFAFVLNTIYRLENIQKEKIEEEEMTSLYQDMELPLVEVLASMEYVGINTDESVLDEIDEQIIEKLKNLEEEIYGEAGEEFNINSPKQLGIILFEKMDFPVIKKTKTGYSTSADVLEKLRGKGEIIDKILDYRKFSKLKSTYIDGLKSVINKKTKRIHSRFMQTVTATGRISSTDPNLQNIPIKTEEGRLIRKAFLASEGGVLVDADYSQIELRVLAALSDDKEMLDAFKHGLDIHRKTASEVFHVDYDDVNDLQRSEAKAVNFGIVYGISDYGLSQNLNIPRKAAKEYIDNYLGHFVGIKDYMSEEIKNGKDKGYVETIFKRRRYIPELNAKNFNIRSFGERIALNTPIQGSAADIIKIAMVKVYNELKKRNLKSKLIIQIHDELVVDTAEDELEEVKELMKDLMENSVDLNVKLSVDMNTGKNLYESK